MKGGKNGQKVHLLLSDDSSSQVEPKVKNNSKLTNLNSLKQRQQQNQEDHEDEQITPQIEEQIQNFIRKSELSKVHKKQNQPQFQNKKEPYNSRAQTNERQQTVISISETQSMNFKPKQSDILKQNLKKYEYMFEVESKINAQSKLKSYTLQSQLSKSNLLKNKLVDVSLLPTQHKSTILNIPVYFPYEPYDLQLEYMKSVIKAASAKDNALLQSPTGTGKTLCLLCAVLSWVDHYRQQNTQKINVIYCSRTHSQLRQVQSQLQKTCFRPTMSNFGSRDHFCIKQQFAGIKGRDLMQSCSKAVKLHLRSNARKRLRYDEQNNQNDFEQSQQPTDQNEKDNKKKQKSLMCDYFKSEGEYLSLVQKHYTNKIITSEMIKAQGQLRGFCPYYYAFQVKQKADLIFMPYNYILDVSRLPFYASIIKNSIIIFDEAHNVPEASCQGRSYQIYSNIFINAELELNKLSYHPSMSPDLRIVSYQFQDTRQMLYRQYQSLRKRLVFWAQKVHDRLSNKNPNNNFQESFDLEQIYSAHEMKIMIYHWFSPIPFNFDQYSKFSIAKRKQIHFETIKTLTIQIKQTNNLIQALKETYDGIFQSMQKLNSFISKSMNLIQVFESDQGKDWWTNQANHYRLSIKCNAKQNNLNYNVKLVCLTPSLTFADVLKLQPRSIILTSGTISPLDSWQKQLKLKFNVRLVNKHVIDQSQLHLGILCKSIGNQSAMNFSYNQLQKDYNIYMGLLKTILRFCQTIPNGILVIFPSYRIIRTFKDLLSKNTVLLNQLRSCKQICFEDKNTADFVVLNFKNKAKTSKGAILFCVCRGKVSEGLDFSDELCRAVVFVGVPYPNVKDPLIQQKRQYYDRLSKQQKKTSVMALSGDEWYTLNTMRAVNQGIGRVIRHIHDYGVILLLDNRYEQTRLKNMLPNWAKSNIRSYYKFQQLDQKIKIFFDQMVAKYPASLRAKVQETQEFSQNVPYPSKKSVMKKKQPKKEDTSRPTNAFDIIMKQAKRNSSKEGVVKKGRKRNELDFL